MGSWNCAKAYAGASDKSAPRITRREFVMSVMVPPAIPLRAV